MKGEASPASPGAGKEQAAARSAESRAATEAVQAEARTRLEQLNRPS